MNHDFVLTWEKMFSGQKYQREDREISQKAWMWKVNLASLTNTAFMILIGDDNAEQKRLKQPNDSFSQKPKL